MKKEDALFCVGQKAFIEKDGSVLILNDPLEGLDFPGGKIQVGETDFVEALKREVREETMLEIEIGEPFIVWYNEFALPHRNAGKKVYLIGFKCKYKSGEVVLSNEHDNFRWVDKDNFHEVDDGTQYFIPLKKYFGLAKKKIWSKEKLKRGSFSKKTAKIPLVKGVPEGRGIF